MTKNTTVGQRFSQLIQALGMSKNAFALSLDKTATVIQHIVEERNKPGFDLLCKVFEVYPNVSKDWLLQGDGSMFPTGGTLAPTPVPVESLRPVVAAEALTAPVLVEAPAAREPEADATQAPVSGHAPVVEASTPVEPQPQPAAVPIAPAVAPAAPQGWEAALYAQQLQHQLALAEQRNQYLLEQQKMLLEQQRMMQQMMEMLRPAR
jgi:hypothetical protein